MKRLFLILFVAIVAATAVQAQQISVVATDGSTDLYNTLQEAIEGADPGSVIYLPGGGFPISDDVKITKKLTIIGIGHKTENDNVDGSTIINGNLFFDQGSDGSALMGVYVAGNVYIGNDENEVDDVLIRYCSIWDFHKKYKCLRTTIDQNYFRGGTYFYGSSANFTNNVTTFVSDLDDGFISNNVITGRCYSNALYVCDRSQITNNIILLKDGGSPHSGDNCIVSGNMLNQDWGEKCIKIENVDWSEVFKNYNGGAVSPVSDFHFNEDYSQYEGKVGVYAGGSDFDKQMAPVPYIVAKRVDKETDASGKLNVKIRVKAGQ